MTLTVSELIKELEKVAEENPDAEIYMKKPYVPVYGCRFRKEENVFEIQN